MTKGIKTEMSQDSPNSSDINSQLIRQNSELTKPSFSSSPSLTEIISRSLIHIKTSKALAVRHRIGEHELCGPDYRLVCIWAEELCLKKEEVLYRLLDRSETTTVVLPGGGMIISNSYGNWVMDELRSNEYTTLVNGSFRRLLIIHSYMPISAIPLISGLMIQNIRLHGDDCYQGCKDFDLNLNSVPDLVELRSHSINIKNFELFVVPKLKKFQCSRAGLSHLDLYGVPALTLLDCAANNLTELDLSSVPALTELNCQVNNLTQLDLSPVPNLSILLCDRNELQKLDLSHVLNLTKLVCEENPITELDIRSLEHLRSLNEWGIDGIYSEKIRLIKRKDQ